MYCVRNIMLSLLLLLFLFLIFGMKFMIFMMVESSTHTLGETNSKREVMRGRIMMAKFIVAEVSTVHITIIDRPILYEFFAITCIGYLCMKMLSNDGPVTM